MPVATVKEPDRETTGLLAQTVSSGPAFAMGPSVMVSKKLSCSATQIPLPVDVNVSTTEPARVSALLAVYVAVSTDESGENVPVPLVAQKPPVATDTVPDRVIMGLFEQTGVSGPAFTNGASVIVILTVSLTGGQPPLAVDVKVSNTEPAV